jgi:hypothetical protein
MKTMEAEHCNRPDSKIPFRTSNYGIDTCPLDEWVITTKRDASKADMRHDRRLPDIAQLLQDDAATRANLNEAEVTAVVLYTGPMVRRPPHCAPWHPVCRLLLCTAPLGLALSCCAPIHIPMFSLRAPHSAS